MKRIGLYLGFPPEGGGVFQYALSILEALVSLRGYEIVVAYSHPAWGAKLQQLGCNWIEIIALDEGKIELAIRSALRFGFPVFLWRAIAKELHPFTRQILAQACDLWVFPAQDVWTYAVPTPTLGVIHDLMHRYEPNFPEVSKFGLFGRRERHYRRLCDQALGVLVDSEIGRHHVAECYALGFDRIHILPYIAPRHIYENKEPADFEERYKLPEDFIFYPAQFWEHKNHSRLLQAMASIREYVSELHLVLVGAKKNAYQRVVAEVERLNLRDRVSFIGYIPDDDIPTFYRRARALVMPTFFGPTNIPPLEAMAVGCPVAISNVYGIPEQVGDAAILFDPSSVVEISNAILRLARDDSLRLRLAEAGKARTKQWGQAQFNARFHEIVIKIIGS